MELRHLRHFVVAAEEENLRRASARLHVAQPALSRTIADLEAELGVLLFARVGRGLVLTAAGRAFAEEARRVLDGAAAGARRAQAVARGEAGVLRVGFLESAAWGGEVPALLSAFRRAHPRIALELRTANSLELIQAVLAGEMHAAAVYAQGEAWPPPGLALRKLREDLVIAALPAAHALARRRAALRLRDLATQDFVLFPRPVAPAYHDRLLAACEAGGLAPRVVQEAASDGVMLSLVSAGVGVALVNSVARFRPPAGVVLRDVEDLALPLALNLVWKAGREATEPALAQLLRL